MAQQCIIRMKATIGNGRTAVWALRFQNQVNPSIPELQIMANSAETVLVTNRTLWSPDVTNIRCTAQTYQRVVFPPQKPHFVGISGEITQSTAVTTGTNGAAFSQSPQTSLAVKLTTDVAGRRARGRVFMWPPPTANQSGGGTTTQFSALAAMVNSLANAVEAAVVGLTTVHVVHSVTFGDINTVTGYSADARLDTQRRRLQRGG